MLTAKWDASSVCVPFLTYMAPVAGGKMLFSKKGVVVLFYAVHQN